MIAAGESYFRSAILDENGDVDAGYYAMAWGLRVWIASSVIVLAFGAYALWKAASTAPDIIQAVGIAQVSISSGFAAMLGAVGLFRMGDKPRAATPGTTTTTKEKTVETESTAAAAPTAAKPMPVVVKNPEPVHVEVKKPTTKGRANRHG